MHFKRKRAHTTRVNSMSIIYHVCINIYFQTFLVGYSYKMLFLSNRLSFGILYNLNFIRKLMTSANADEQKPLNLSLYIVCYLCRVTLINNNSVRCCLFFLCFVLGRLSAISSSTHVCTQYAMHSAWLQCCVNLCVCYIPYYDDDQYQSGTKVWTAKLGARCCMRLLYI